MAETAFLQNPARYIALRVDGLIAQARYRPEFERQIETYKQEAIEAEREKREEKDRLHAAEQAAIRAVWEETQAVEAGEAAPCLTDESKPPGENWLWRPEHYREFDDQGAITLEEPVEGWLSPEFLEAREKLNALQKREWPGPNPSPATMFALLAAFRDEYLSNVRTVLDPLTGIPAEAARSEDRGMLLLLGARFWCMAAMRDRPERLGTLYSYLNDVTKYLNEHCPERPVQEERSEPPETRAARESERERARQIAREVSRLYYDGNNAEVWQRQIKAYEKEADEHWDEVARATDDRFAAIEAVWNEQEAVKAGTCENRLLTDSDSSPGEGYLWRQEPYRVEEDADGTVTVDYAEGWMPAEPFERHGTLTADWPWSNPSLAAKFTLLASLHDTYFGGKASNICGPNVWRAVFGSIPPGVAFKDGFFSISEYFEAAEGPPQYEHDYMDVIETYLDHVRRELATGAQGTPDTQQGARQAPAHAEPRDLPTPPEAKSPLRKPEAGGTMSDAEILWEAARRERTAGLSCRQGQRDLLRQTINQRVLYPLYLPKERI